jgi:hypothetical protein
LDVVLRRLLSRLSVARVPRDTLPERIRGETARVAVERVRKALTQRQSGQAAEESAQTKLDKLQGDYDKLGDEALEIVDRNEQLEKKVTALSAELETAKANLLAVTSWKDEPEDRDEAVDGDQEPPESWGEFADRVDDLVGPGFSLTARGEQCARENAYPSPRRMWEHLQRLSEAGHSYYEAGGAVGDRFAEWGGTTFRLDVALQDSSYAATTFTYEGHELSRLPHVKIDDAVAPNEVGRIYFAIDSDRSRLVVDWFGVKRDRP